MAQVVRFCGLARDERPLPFYNNPTMDDRKASVALIVGSLGGIITMAIHPVAGGKMTPDQVERLATVSGIAHGLALASVLVLFLGTWGLARILAGPDRISYAALATFGFSAVAVMIAASVSGWVIPNIITLMARDNPANQGTWKIAIASIFQINQAMSRIYSVGTAVAITLWSVCVLRMRRPGRGLAIYGCLTSPLVAMLIILGYLPLHVHGMTVVMLSEVIWFGGMGLLLLLLWRTEAQARAMVK
jgi:hypothetical protein